MIAIWLRKKRRKLKEIILKLMGDDNPSYKAAFWPEIKCIKLDNHQLLQCKKKIICHASYVRDFCFERQVISIIGSGPSVNLINIDEICKHTEIVVLNGAINIVVEYDIEPSLLIIVDVSFAREQMNLIRKIKAGTKLLTTVEVVKEIHDCDTDLLRNFCVYITHPYNLKQKLEKIDLDIGYVEAGTVMAVALQLCLQKKVSEIFLVGFDIGGDRFYDEGDNILHSGLIRDYEKLILPFMKDCMRIANTKGTDIYNCSPCSRLPYSVVKYSDRFNED